MISDFSDLYKRSAPIQERGRGFNYLYLTSTSSMCVEEAFNELKPRPVLNDFLKEAMQIRILLKIKNANIKEINDGTFMNSNSPLSLLLWAAHSAQIISLDPSTPFMEFKRSPYNKTYIGRIWYRESISQLTEIKQNDLLKAFGKECIDNNNLEDFFTNTFAKYDIEIFFKNGYCNISLKRFVHKCASYMIFEDYGKPESMVNLVLALFPRLMPNIIKEYYKFTMEEIPKKELIAEKAKFNMVFHKLKLDYSLLATNCPLYHQDIVRYIQEKFRINSPKKKDFEGGLGDKLSRLCSRNLKLVGPDYQTGGYFYSLIFNYLKM